MATFLLLYIACLLSMDYVTKYFLLLDILTPILALVLSGIIAGAIALIKSEINAQPKTQGHYIYNPNKKD